MSDASAIPEHLVAYGSVMGEQSEAVTTAAGPLGEALDAFRASDSEGKPAVPALDDTMRSLATGITTLGDFVRDVGLAFEKAAGSGQREPGTPITVSESALDTALTQVKREQIARGEEIARRMRELLGDPPEYETTSVTQQEMADLLAELEGLDPDTAAGLVNELGVDGVDDMLSYVDLVRTDPTVRNFQDPPLSSEDVDLRYLAPFATTVALATHSDSLRSEVRSGLIGGNPYDRDVDLDDDQLDRVSQLLRYGSYETTFLVAAAERVMDAAPQPTTEGELTDPLRPSQIAAEALERNPEAAWKFMWNREENSALLMDPVRFGDGNAAAGRVAELGLLTYPADHDEGTRQLATLGTEYFIHNAIDAGELPAPLQQAGAVIIYPHRNEIAEAANNPTLTTESPGESGFNVGRADLVDFLTIVADDEVARDRLAVTAQVYAGEQIQSGVDASVTGGPNAGNDQYTRAGGMIDLFSTAVGEAADDTAEGEAYEARLWGAAAKTGLEVVGSASAAAPGPWAVPAAAAADGGKSILGFIIDESVQNAENAAQDAADATFDDYADNAQVSVQTLIVDNLVNHPDALADPPRIPVEFDPDRNGRIDMPPVGSPEHNDYLHWLNADSVDDLPPSIPEGERQAELARLRTMRNEMIEIYGTLDELVPNRR